MSKNLAKIASTAIALIMPYAVSCVLCGADIADAQDQSSWMQGFRARE